VFRAEAAGTYALKFFKQDFVRDYILNDHVQVIIGEAPELSVTGYFNPALDRGRVVAEPRWPTVPEEAELFRRGESNAAGASPGPAAGNAQRPGIIDEGIVPVRPPEASISAPSSVSSGIATSAAASPGPVPAAPAASPGPVLEADSQTAAARPPVPEAPPEQYLQRAQEEFDAGRVAAAIDILDQFREWYPMGSDEAYWLYGQFFEASSPSRDIRLSLDYYRRLVREYPQSRRYNEARRRIAYLERYYINIQ
jgi:TolA-binding protein